MAKRFTKSSWNDQKCGSTCGPGWKTRSRRAFTIVEMIGTCILLGLMFSMTVPMLMLVAKERRSTEQRQFALQHLENLLEQALSRPESELAVGKLKIPDADPDLIAVLPGLERSLTVKAIPGENGVRQLVASVHWQSSAGQFSAPMHLSAWIYPTKEAP